MLHILHPLPKLPRIGRAIQARDKKILPLEKFWIPLIDISNAKVDVAAIAVVQVSKDHVILLIRW